MDQQSIQTEFIEEAEDLLSSCEQAFQALQQDSHSREALDSIFRALHTIKGSAGVVGYNDLSQLVHRMEDVIDACRSLGHIPSDYLGLILEGSDRVAQWLEALRHDEQIVFDVEALLSKLVAKLERLRQKPMSGQQKASLDAKAGFAFFEDLENRNTIGRIMLVDDEPQLLTAVTACLDDLPYEVRGFSSAKDGLNALDQDVYDLVISDLSMPEMDGISFISEIRQRGYLCEIIAFSGFSNRERLEQLLRLNVFGFVAKGEDPIELQTVVTNAMRAKKVRDAIQYMTKLNMEIYVDFKLLQRGNESHRETVEQRLHHKLQKVSELTHLIADPDEILGTRFDQSA